jgi:hypothetical protein
MKRRKASGSEQGNGTAERPNVDSEMMGEEMMSVMYALS